MNISELFTKKNMEILELLTKKSLHIREIAEQLGCSPAKVHNTIQLFKKYELVKEVQEKNKKIISLNRNNPLLGTIRSLTSGEKEATEETINLFESISPMDFRYYGRSKLKDKLMPYLSEEGFVRYLAKAEAALTRVLAEKGVCSEQIADEVEKASKKISAHDVYVEEERIKKNIRALANCIRKNVSEKAKPYVHFTATSHDIICTAEAARYKEFTNNVLLPELLKLEKTLIELALREKDTLQIGRTHGQHAEPITFGFAIALYVSRIGQAILKIRKAANNLRGKMAGAVGAYNASSLFFNNPVDFEKDVLDELGLKPSPISTQIVEPEFVLDYAHSVISCFGILANLADDMRHLQRSEIGEVGEFFEAKQVGSSTMPQKRNPINFENVKSLWKSMMPRMITLYSDQISEHQRDLTNSASSRFTPEILAGFIVSVDRMQRVMSKLVVDRENLKRNFEKSKSMLTAEPAYILLAAYNHPDAHEHIRELTLESQKTGKSLSELIRKDKSLEQYLKKLNKKQKEILENPEKYTGIAAKKAEDVCKFWKKELKI